MANWYGLDTAIEYSPAVPEPTPSFGCLFPCGAATTATTATSFLHLYNLAGAGNLVRTHHVAAEYRPAVPSHHLALAAFP